MFDAVPQSPKHFNDLPHHYFDLIAADPPWLVKIRSEKGIKKTPQAQYKCMPMAEIMSMPVGRLAKRDAWLLLWTVAPLLDECMDVGKAWGFKYISRINWEKTHESGAMAMGLGWVVRSLDETCLIFKRGLPPFQQPFRSMFKGVRREHSRKPETFYQNVDLFMPAPARKLDLFSRQSREGWMNWGLERDKFDLELLS